MYVQCSCAYILQCCEFLPVKQQCKVVRGIGLLRNVSIKARMVKLEKAFARVECLLAYNWLSISEEVCAGLCSGNGSDG